MWSCDDLLVYYIADNLLFNGCQSYLDMTHLIPSARSALWCVTCTNKSSLAVLRPAGSIKFSSSSISCKSCVSETNSDTLFSVRLIDQVQLFAHCKKGIPEVVVGNLVHHALWKHFEILHAPFLYDSRDKDLSIHVQYNSASIRVRRGIPDE